MCFGKKSFILLLSALLMASTGCSSAPQNQDAQSTAEPTAKTEVKTTADVLVIGAGLSGLSASIRAAQQGAEVIVLEKMLEATVFFPPEFYKLPVHGCRPRQELKIPQSNMPRIWRREPVRIGIRFK